MNEINFYSRKKEYGWLSNFWRCAQTIDEIVYPTNEHYYQSMKTCYRDIAVWIINAPNPYLAMKAGRSLRKHEMIENWEAIKVQVMLKGLKAKFQNPELRQKLLDTGDATLHEDSPTDLFWGKKGQDMLGKLLMIVREENKNGKTL